MKIADKKKRTQIIIVLGLLTAIGPFSIDMYLPSFPEISKSLGTSVSQVMLSLTTFFLGISIGQMVYGPLIERYGRKKPLYFGLILYMISSIGCMTAISVESLIIFRLFQALGGCVGMVASRAMVRDLFEVKENAKIFSVLMLVVAISPIIAPTLGGYVTAAFGWRVVFGVLLLIILVILLSVYFLLPESKEADPGFSLKPGPIVKNFLYILKHPQFGTYAFTGAITYGGLSAYISGSADVFMNTFSANEKQYGWIFAIIAIGIISASQLNNLVLKYQSSENIIFYSMILQSVVGVSLVILSASGMISMASSIILIFIFIACQGFIFPNVSALSMAAFGHTAGSASALLGFIQMSVGATMSAAVSYFQNGTTLPMTGVMAFSSVLALLVYLLGRRMIINKASVILVEEEEVEMINTI